MGTDISKGGFNSEEKGEWIDKGIDWTAHTIKGVLNGSLASNVLGDRGSACMHEQCASRVSLPERRPYKPPHIILEDPRNVFVPWPASRVE